MQVRIEYPHVFGRVSSFNDGVLLLRVTMYNLR